MHINLTMKESDKPISLNFHLSNTIGDVWTAISNHRSMLNWYFENIPDFRAEIGFKTSFVVQSDTRKFTHNWEVVEVEPESVIAYKWEYLEYEGDSIVRFTLHKTDAGTRINLNVVILEDFSDDIPEFRRESCVGGWNYFLDGRLRHYLEN